MCNCMRLAYTFQLSPRFFQKIGDFASALQFLVLSHCNEEAYTMAEVPTACVRLYCSLCHQLIKS